MEILRKGISYFLCAKLSQAEICTCGDFSLARPHHFEEMPVWWNGIHSGLRNRGGSMRVQVSPQVLIIWSHRINGQFTGLSIRKCWVRVSFRSGVDSPLGSLINAVCPGGEGAVLKTVGLSGLAGSNPVCGAYRWMSRIGNAADCKSVASALGVQVSLRSVRVKHSLTRVD